MTCNKGLVRVWIMFCYFTGLTSGFLLNNGSPGQLGPGQLGQNSSTDTITTHIPTDTTNSKTVTTSSSIAGSSSTDSGVCENKIDTCTQYGRAACTDKTYEAWARDNCPLHCGFCVPAIPLTTFCQDKLGNCHEYDNNGELCTDQQYYVWAYENCRGYCKFEHCNDNVCEDSPDVNCTQLDEQEDICSDVNKSSSVCRNYCGLCNATDGSWCSWSSWGSCDVTCDNGTRLRTRQCACPAVADGGENCAGLDTDLQTCVAGYCPGSVDGMWSSWHDWSGCSATCDLGIQRRDRLCSNPAPSGSGLPCVGDAYDDKICTANACTDGQWSDWSGWGNCSMSCEGGIRSRSRTCTNPRPSLTGKYCDGNPIVVGTCNTQPCSDHRVAFLAYGCQTGFPSDVITFPGVNINHHNDYDPLTGKFTCVTPGLYHFAVTLTKVRRFVDLLNAHIVLNGQNVFELHADPAEHGDADYSSYSLTGTVTLHVKQGEEVYVTGASRYYYNDISSSFTGFLILADN